MIQFVRGLGGVRGTGLVWSPKLINPGRISRQLIHISDWLPTLLTAVGGDPSNLAIDGVDMWRALNEDTISPRKMVLHNIDDIYGIAGITYGDWKFIQGKREKKTDPLRHDDSWIFSKIWIEIRFFAKGLPITANGTIGTVRRGGIGRTTPMRWWRAQLVEQRPAWACPWPQGI